MEGIPDHHEPYSFTRRWSRWSWRLLHTPREKPAKVGLTASGRRRGDRDVRGSVGHGTVGRKHPRSRVGRQHLSSTRPTHTTRHQNRVSWTDPPKRSGRRENARSPGQACRIPESGRRPRGESRGSVAGNMRGAGARSFVRVAEVDRTHRASCPLGDRKVSWRRNTAGR